MWHRFSPDLRNAILAAVVRTGGEEPLTTSHLLEALAAEHLAPAAQILRVLGMAPEALHHSLCQTVRQEGDSEDESKADCSEIVVTPEARAAIEQAYQLAAQLHDTYIGGEHLLLAFLQDPSGSDAGRALAHAGVTRVKAAPVLFAKQRWRIHPLEEVPIPHLSFRHLKRRVRNARAWSKFLLYGVIRPDHPFLPYLLFQKRVRNNPYPFYARLRRRPFYWDSKIQQWFVTGYEDVAATLAETQFSSQTYNLDFSSEEVPSPSIALEFRRLESSLGRQMLFL